MGCANDSEKEKEKNKKKLTMSTREVINPITLKTKQEVKIVLLGEAGVGKSSLVNRYCKGTFSESYKITIGGAYLKKEIILKNGNSLIFHFWDTGGQERFRSMASLYYKDASAAILCFDVGDKKTLDALTFWIEELKEKGNPPFGFPLVFAIAGNKCDIDNNLKQVSFEDLKIFAQKQKIDIFFETSAKGNIGIIELINSIANKLYLLFDNTKMN